MSCASPIAITIGDTAGIGAEIIRSWAFENAQMRKNSCVIAHKSFLDTLPDDIGKCQVGDSAYEATAGLPDKEGARVALLALEESA